MSVNSGPVFCKVGNSITTGNKVASLGKLLVSSNPFRFTLNRARQMLNPKTAEIRVIRFRSDYGCLGPNRPSSQVPRWIVVVMPGCKFGGETSGDGRVEPNELGTFTRDECEGVFVGSEFWS
ncbi:hypothetical protein L2E82_18762 [Cichorium intybus]|uniref:Uncharacterized protein n=1 Tax=Cichorium intybus TaxID=13427 RepID=A0ACB9FBN5_CICIN|nr:hypothetical protein L2E82_18762 [Cichorium intybus]